MKNKYRKFFDEAFEHNNHDRYDETIKSYTKAIKLSPNSIMAHSNRGLCYYNAGEYDKAIKDHTKCISMIKHYNNYYYSHDYTYVYNNRGNAYLAKCEYDNAIIDYTKAIKIYTQVINQSLSLKKDRVISENHPIILRANAIEIDPNYAYVYYNRGLSYYNKKEYDKAILDYTKAIEIDPNYAKVYYNRSIAYDNIKEHDKAISDYNKAIEIDPKYRKKL